MCAGRSAMSLGGAMPVMIDAPEFSPTSLEERRYALQRCGRSLVEFQKTFHYLAPEVAEAKLDGLARQGILVKRWRQTTVHSAQGAATTLEAVYHTTDAGDFLDMALTYRSLGPVGQSIIKLYLHENIPTQGYNQKQMAAMLGHRPTVIRDAMQIIQREQLLDKAYSTSGRIGYVPRAPRPRAMLQEVKAQRSEWRQALQGEIVTGYTGCPLPPVPGAPVLTPVAMTEAETCWTLEAERLGVQAFAGQFGYDEIEAQVRLDSLVASGQVEKQDRVEVSITNDEIQREHTAAYTVTDYHRRLQAASLFHSLNTDEQAMMEFFAHSAAAYPGLNQRGLAEETGYTRAETSTLIQSLTKKHLLDTRRDEENYLGYYVPGYNSPGATMIKEIAEGSEEWYAALQQQ